MFKNLLLLICCLSFSAMAQEFRPFIDRSGRAIEAKVLGLKNNVVELELRNGKKGRIPLSELELTEEDKLFFNELKISSAFSDPQIVPLKISEKTSPHVDEILTRKGKQHTYTFTVSNQSDIDFKKVFVEYCIYRKLSDKKNRSTNLELATKDLPAGKTVTLQTTETHATFKSSGRMSISGLRLRLYYELSDGSMTIREQCFPKSLPLESFPWMRSKREMLAERSKSPAPSSYPAREMTEREILKLAEAYAEVWREDDYEAWKALFYPMHVGSQKLEPGVFARKAEMVKFLKVIKVDGRNVKVRVAYKNSKAEEEGWVQITPSGHIKYTPLIFEHPFRQACMSAGMLGSSFSYLREPSLEKLKEMNVSLFGYNPYAGSYHVKASQIVDWLSGRQATFDVSEPYVYLPKEDADTAIEGARNMLKFFAAN